MKKLRPLGNITQDLEPLIEEMVEGHDMQWNEILAIIHSYLVVHYPDAQEKYLDGTSPEFYYGEKK